MDIDKVEKLINSLDKEKQKEKQTVYENKAKKILEEMERLSKLSDTREEKLPDEYYKLLFEYIFLRGEMENEMNPNGGPAFKLSEDETGGMYITEVEKKDDQI